MKPALNVRFVLPRRPSVLETLSKDATDCLNVLWCVSAKKMHHDDDPTPVQSIICVTMAVLRATWRL